jgi:hypothetical protein
MRGKRVASHVAKSVAQGHEFDLTAMYKPSSAAASKSAASARAFRTRQNAPPACICTAQMFLDNCGVCMCGFSAVVATHAGGGDVQGAQDGQDVDGVDAHTRDMGQASTRPKGIAGGAERTGRQQMSRAGSGEPSTSLPSPAPSLASGFKSPLAGAASTFKGNSELPQSAPSGVWGIIGTPAAAFQGAHTGRETQGGAATAMNGGWSPRHAGRAKSIGVLSPAVSGAGSWARGRAKSIGAGSVDEDERTAWRAQRRVVREEMYRYCGRMG